MSTHIAEVVPVVLEKHDNADSLSIVRIRGWQCVVRTEDFAGKDRGIYIPIDMVVPDTPEFAFLSEKRIKTHKFRGAISQGLLIPAKPGMKIGDDVTEKMGITRYVPKLPGNKTKLKGGNVIAPPPGMVKYTDIENWKNYTDIFAPGEMVVITEKIHGANSRFALLEGVFYVGSHNTVRKIAKKDPEGWFGWGFRMLRKLGFIPPPDVPSTWQKVAEKYDIERKIRQEFGEECDVILFGEIYGPNVQSVMPYGVPEGEARVAFFDIMVNGEYCDWNETKHRLNLMGLDSVPMLGVKPWDASILQLVDGPAFAGKHIREGLVVRPFIGETPHPKLGRKIIKLISERYQLKDYEEQPEE